MFQQVQIIFKSMIIPTPEGEAGFPESGKCFAHGILESRALESGIQLKEPGMSRTTGIPNVIKVPLTRNPEIQP